MEHLQTVHSIKLERSILFTCEYCEKRFVEIKVRKITKLLPLELSNSVELTSFFFLYNYTFLIHLILVRAKVKRIIKNGDINKIGNWV